jgi:hypothetical protein
MTNFFVELVHYGLRNCEITSRQQYQGAIIRTLEDMHLPKGVDVVDASVGARIGKEHHSRIEQSCDAVSHA